jgi:hypothetical protein
MSGESVSSTLLAAGAGVVGDEGRARTGASTVTSVAAEGGEAVEEVRMLEKLMVSRTRSISGVTAVSVMVAVVMLLVSVSRNDGAVRNTGWVVT